MYPYLRNESDEEEFNAIFDVACKLFSKRASTRNKAADKLAGMGKKAVRPLACTLERAIWKGMSDDDLEALTGDVEDILVKIGEDVLPDLEYFATAAICKMYINEFAQEAIFKVMGLEGNDKRKVCKHLIKALIEQGKKKTWRCMFCDAEFECKKGKRIGNMIGED